MIGVGAVLRLVSKSARGESTCIDYSLDRTGIGIVRAKC
jgi:hypothetical protein